MGVEPVRVYSADSDLRRPRQMIADIKRDLSSAGPLAWRLLVRNLSTRYRQSMLGYVWAFLPPIVTTATFVLLRSGNVVGIAETPVAYAAYVLAGTLVWQVFVESVTTILRLAKNARAMLAKISFPREALIGAAVGEVGFNMLVRLILLVPVYAYFDVVPNGWLVLAPVALLALAGLGLMVGIFLAPFAILFDDVEWGVGTIMGLWFFVTPVVYPPPTEGLAATVVALNPVTPLLTAGRDALIGVPPGSLASAGAVGAATVVLLLVGWVVFRLSMPHLIARLSA